MAPAFSSFHSGQPIPLRNVPDLSIVEFRAAILSAVSSGSSLAALSGCPPRISTFN
jgi:hypothetical protein